MDTAQHFKMHWTPPSQNKELSSPICNSAGVNPDVEDGLGGWGRNTEDKYREKQVEDNSPMVSNNLNKNLNRSKR